ncbi:MAG: TrkH family potassium uptake protein [Candidatus Eiseniibacteriota bacterium]
MIDLRPVLYVCGILVATLGVLMTLPSVVDAAAGHPDWQAFALSALLTLFVGGGLVLTNRMDRYRMNLRQAFVMTALCWIMAAVFGAMPMAFSKLGLSYTDAFFEAMSGITTTGSTVISGLDTAPHGLLLWRALLQWLGGIGIVITALAVLPMLRVGGMQLFRTEGAEGQEQILPRAAAQITGIGLAYLGFTIVIAIALWLAGMTPFDAVIHAMTSISTGGFSSRDRSVGYYDTAGVEWILIAAMILGSLPFVYYIDTLRGHTGPILRDRQVQWFFGIAGTNVALIAIWLWLAAGQTPMRALTLSAFHVVSLMTGTGYFTADFNQWGGLPLVMLVGLMFVGGCAGSTTCGIKVFRFQVAYEVARVQIARLLQPHGVFLPYFNRRPITDDVAIAVIGFFFAYVLCFIVLALALGVLGLDLLTSLSGAATAISNVGPGIGDVIGPLGTYGGLPDAAKWLLSAGMLLGRLELFTILVLFMPSFWRG